MKVIHVTTSTVGGGAGIAAKRLSKALLDKGIDSKIFSEEIETERRASLMSLVSGLKIRSRLGKLPFVLRIRRRAAYRSYSWLPSRIPDRLNKMRPDIVHLHWFQGEFLSIEDVERIEAPVIWTLHDCWPILGSEHHSRKSLREKTEQICVDEFDELNKSLVEKWMLKRKVRLFGRKKPWLVAPSLWMKRMIKSSHIGSMTDSRVSLIPNCLDSNIFRPGTSERSLFDLPEGFLMLLGSLDGSQDIVKGHDLLIEALKKDLYISQEVTLVVVGFDDENLRRDLADYKIKSVPRINDERLMAELYKSVDLVCIPSRIENLPQMATEAACCGTPVVCFDVGGLSEIVIHKKTGYLATAHDIDALASGVMFCKDNIDMIRKYCVEQSKLLTQKWSESIVSSMYIELYSKLLSAD